VLAVSAPVVQAVREGVAYLARRPQVARVVAIGEDPAVIMREPVEALRH
jgi:L-lysine 2,3-aminomutase